jgi:hypothetical protein
VPVKKFKTFDAAREDLWNFYPDSEWIKRAFRIFSLAKFKKKTPFRKGIKKFKSFEEAEREKYGG